MQTEKNIAVDSQADNTCSSASLSAGSTVRLYFALTWTTRSGKPALIHVGKPVGGVSITFLVPVDSGLARVRLSRSRANSFLRSTVSAHMPLSWASERATMCSMSVSLVLLKQVPV